MPSKATVSVLGHAGGDPELKDVGEGLVVFSVASSTGKKVNGEWENHTTWWNVKVWGKYANKLLGKFKKGDLIEVNGEAALEFWTTKDGKEVPSLEIKADSRGVISMVKHESRQAAASVSDDTEDLPF